MAGSNRYVLSTLLSLEEGRPDGAAARRRRAGRGAPAAYLDRWAADRRGLDPCLFFDQFEELFTLDPTDQDDKAAFLDELGVALRDRGRWALFADARGLHRAARPVPRADPEAARQPLPARPARRRGGDGGRPPARRPRWASTSPPPPPRRLVDDLRTVRVQRGTTVSDEPGPYVEPVQLQVVCRQLWTSLGDDATAIEPDDVDALGNVDDALADFYVDQVRVRRRRAPAASEREIRDWFDGR